MDKEEVICPCCFNHCHKDNLNCGKGRAYFKGIEEKKLKEKNTQSNN